MRTSKFTVGGSSPRAEARRGRRRRRRDLRRAPDHRDDVLPLEAEVHGSGPWLRELRQLRTRTEAQQVVADLTLDTCCKTHAKKLLRPAEKRMLVAVAGERTG